jgi:hypothetical protein
MKLKQSPNQRQRFVISPELFKSVSPEEVEATWQIMTKFNINKPPYQYFDIELSSENVFSKQVTIPKGTKYHNFENLLEEAAKVTHYIPGRNVLIKYDFQDDLKDIGCIASMWVDAGDGIFVKFIPTKNGMSEAHTSYDNYSKRRTELGTLEVYTETIPPFCTAIYKLLVVLLATKNIIKEIKIDKLAKLGIGKNKHKPHTVTYLKIGKITETITKSGKPVPTGTILMPHLRSGHIRHQHYGLGNKYIKEIYIHSTFVNADKDWIADRTEYRVL